jgi:Meiotic cell cortex C-terminal pleckstrin homology
LNWADQPPSENSGGKTKSAFISAVNWREAPISRNYPPTFQNCINISTGSREITLQPMSWEIHDRWVEGVGFLLKRTRTKVPIHEQFKMVQDFQTTANSEAENESSNTESDSEEEDPFSSPRHRRLKTSGSSVRNLSGNRPTSYESTSILSTPRRLTTNLWKRATRKPFPL